MIVVRLHCRVCCLLFVARRQPPSSTSSLKRRPRFLHSARRAAVTYLFARRRRRRLRPTPKVNTRTSVSISSLFVYFSSLVCVTKLKIETFPLAVAGERNSFVQRVSCRPPPFVVQTTTATEDQCPPPVLFACHTQVSGNVTATQRRQEFALIANNSATNGETERVL